MYTRSPDKVGSFISAFGNYPDEDCNVLEGYSDLQKYSYDVIINCVGVGTLNKIHKEYSSWFTVTEEYDNLAIGYLRDISTDTLYISFSSGAVYGRAFSAPVEENSINEIRVNHLTTEDYYAIARLNAETKHRSFSNLRIVDLRVFSYFSRFIDLSDRYFITEIMDCILNEKVLETNEQNIIRDYIHPEDLFSIIKKCMVAGRINDAFDVISAETVEKKEILDFFQREYGLKYNINPLLNSASGTGSKNIYCSKYNKALKIGYTPEFSSMDVIKQESKFILSDEAPHRKQRGISMSFRNLHSK